MLIEAQVGPGYLKITADAEAREELKGDYSHAEQVVNEGLHEKWSFISPEEVGAMTDSPILAMEDEIERDDMGDLTQIGLHAWFPNYMVENPWEQLAKYGSVRFKLVGNSERPIYQIALDINDYKNFIGGRGSSGPRWHTESVRHTDRCQIWLRGICIGEYTRNQKVPATVNLYSMIHHPCHEAEEILRMLGADVDAAKLYLRESTESGAA